MTHMQGLRQCLMDIVFCDWKCEVAVFVMYFKWSFGDFMAWIGSTWSSHLVRIMFQVCSRCAVCEVRLVKQFNDLLNGHWSPRCVHVLSWIWINFRICRQLKQLRKKVQFDYSFQTLAKFIVERTCCSWTMCIFGEDLYFKIVTIQG